MWRPGFPLPLQTPLAPHFPRGGSGPVCRVPAAPCELLQTCRTGVNCYNLPQHNLTWPLTVFHVNIYVASERLAWEMWLRKRWRNVSPGTSLVTELEWKKQGRKYICSTALGCPGGYPAIHLQGSLQPPVLYHSHLPQLIRYLLPVNTNADRERNAWSSHS